MHLIRRPTKLLIRPRALPGESLSSWRQRVGWENGYRLFPLSRGSLRRTDPDLGIADLDIGWVAALHDATEETCREMTLSGHVGRVINHIDPHSKPRWWIRCRQDKDCGHHGSMFCPLCLATDPEPYFRLGWRYAFSTVCSKHHTLLQDRCPRCGQPPWPSISRVAGRVSARYASLALCPYCDFNLSSVEIQDLASPNEADMVTTSPDQLISIFNASQMEGLMAIRSICQLFLRPRSQRVLLESGTRWAGIVRAVTDQRPNVQVVDDACVAVRHLLVTVALDVCKDWPNSFLNFAIQTGITRSHFSGLTRSLPAWMNDVINESLIWPQSLARSGKV